MEFSKEEKEMLDSITNNGNRRPMFSNLPSKDWLQLLLIGLIVFLILGSLMFFTFPILDKTPLTSKRTDKILYLIIFAGIYFMGFFQIKQLKALVKKLYARIQELEGKK